MQKAHGIDRGIRVARGHRGHPRNSPTSRRSAHELPDAPLTAEVIALPIRKSHAPLVSGMAGAVRARRGRRGTRSPEAKASKAGALIALTRPGGRSGRSRSYAALARAGYMRNPVVYRAVRMVAEAAASLPWLLYDGAAELDDHPLLTLLAKPNPRQSAAEFLEALYRASARRRQRLCRGGRGRTARSASSSRCGPTG